MVNEKIEKDPQEEERHEANYKKAKALIVDISDERLKQKLGMILNAIDRIYGYTGINKSSIEAMHLAARNATRMLLDYLEIK